MNKNYEMIVYHNLSQILTFLNYIYQMNPNHVIFALNKNYWLKWQIFQHQIHNELLCIIS